MFGLPPIPPPGIRLKPLQNETKAEYMKRLGLDEESFKKINDVYKFFKE